MELPLLACVDVDYREVGAVAAAILFLDWSTADALAEAQRDGDRIYAVVRGSAVNSDGRTNGLLITPSQPGQVALLQAAYSAAGVPPASATEAVHSG